MSEKVSCSECSVGFYKTENETGRGARCDACGHELAAAPPVRTDFELLREKNCFQCGALHQGIKGLCEKCMNEVAVLDGPPPRQRIDAGTDTSWPRVGCGGLAAAWGGIAIVRSFTVPQKRYRNPAYQTGRDSGKAFGIAICFFLLVFGLYQVGRGFNR